VSASSHSLATPTQMSQRRIAPLPVRPRSSSGQPGKSSKSPNPHSLSPQSSKEPSNHRHSYHYQDATAVVHHLFPPIVSSPRAPFRFSELGSKSQPDEQSTAFTFRALHNVTPRPSPEPEDVRVAPSQIPSIRLSSSSWPILSTAEREHPQSLHAFNSDEKVAIDGVHDLSEPVDPFSIAHSPNLEAGVSVASPLRSVPSFSFIQPSELSPSPSPHSRRVSDISAVSEDNDTLVSYDVREENTPPEPFFTPAFQTALQHGLDIAKSTVAALEKVGDSSKFRGDLKRLLRDSKDLSTFQSSDTRTIAVLGDTGEGKDKCCQREEMMLTTAGKSSLINSLLHFPEIAKTVSSS
jgi:hypothetical protein